MAKRIKIEPKNGQFLTKSEICEYVAKITSLPNSQVRQTLDAFTHLAINECIVREEFRWDNLVIIHSQYRKARKLHNVTTKEMVDVDETTVLRAKLSPTLKRQHQLYKKMKKNK